MVHTTPVTLLQRIRRGDGTDAWDRFVQLYSPLLFFWALKQGANEADAADLVQEVFVVLIQTLPTFEYNPSQSFRSYLRTILVNKWRDRLRQAAAQPQLVPGQVLEQTVAVDPGDVLGEEEYRQHLLAHAMRLMQTDFEATTWKACWECVVNGRAAKDVAAELKISVNAVWLATSRVLRHLRAELQGLLD